VKTLVFVCDGAFVLALVPGDRRADEQAVAQAVGASSVRVATADEVVLATGFEPGGVAPFPQRDVSQTLIDSSFFAHGVVWIGAGTAQHMASLPPPELARLAAARTVDLGASG
jgi:prolyl-tRNA editing enzyme YbaK/EbsC (Cys-tRNA(Pro) deacylase)